jgi:hypothetical protein
VNDTTYEGHRFDPCPPDELPEGATYRTDSVAHHTTERWSVAAGRTVVDVPGREWPASCPEECVDFSMKGEWLNDHLMVCPGCGLDAT